MAANAEYEDQRKGRGIGRISSQAGLNAHAGGRIKSLPSVPAPRQPGSRFNPVVADRNDEASVQGPSRGVRTKSLVIGTPPGMIQGIPPAIMNSGAEKEDEETVAGAAARGFAGGALAGAQLRMFGAPDGDHQDAANPSWRENNRDAVALNTKIMAASAESIALMDRDISAMNHPSDAAYRVQLIAARAKAVEGLKEMQVTMAHDQVNEDVQAGAHTDADVTALRENLNQLHAANERMSANQQQRGGLAPRGRSVGRTAPVRNANGQSLADLTAPAPAPGEYPLPGARVVPDALNAAQGAPAKHAPKGASRGVFMNPAHVAVLEALDARQDGGLERGSHYGR